MKKSIACLITLALVGCNSGSSNTSTDTKKKNVFTSTCTQNIADYGKPLTFTVDGNNAKLEGIICSGSPDAFNQMMSQHSELTTLHFINIDGSINDEANLKLAYAVRNKGLNAHIGAKGSIASGGTDLFIAGVKRTVEKGAKIGVHSWGYDDDNGQSVEGVNLPVDHDDHKPYISYYKKMSLPDPKGFYWFTLNSAGLNDMHNMTMEEIKKFGLSTDAIEGSQTHFTTPSDVAMITQMKALLSVNNWKGFNYSTEPQYLVRVDNNDQPQAAFVINPKTTIKGAEKLGSNESQGLTIFKFNDDMLRAIQNINDGGNSLYSLNFNIDGKTYYAQKYTDAVTTTQHPYTNDLMFSPHEVFHVYQNNWQHNGEWVQDVTGYPTTESIITDELLLTEILKGLPKKITSDEARRRLTQYVAIRKNQMNNDNTALVKNMALFQERGEGSAQYVGILAARAVFGETYDDILFDQTAKYGFDIKDKKTRQWHFGFNVFYNTGASVIFLLNELGYDITKLEGNITPFDAAMSVVDYKETAYQDAVKSVGPKIEDMKADAKKYAALK